jgi:hypothetical protein
MLSVRAVVLADKMSIKVILFFSTLYFVVPLSSFGSLSLFWVALGCVLVGSLFVGVIFP